MQVNEAERTHSAPRPDRRSNCPVACTLDLVGDKWTLLVVRDLLLGKSRYSELAASSEHIPTNILADRLKRLEQAGMIEATPFEGQSRRKEYRLTAEGRSLGHLVNAMVGWGLRHVPN